MVEGFYGTLKKFTEHRIESSGQLVKSVYICAENMFVTSRYVKQYRIPDHLMAPEQSMKIGYFALKRVKEEYDADVSYPSKTVFGPKCCKTNKIYGIPCHNLINPRWLQNYEISIIKNVPNTVSIKKEQKFDDNDWTYSACVHRFERYFTVAKRSIRIQKIFEDCLYHLQIAEQESGSEAVIRPSDSLLISGTFTVYPKNNAEAPGARQTRKKYKNRKDKKLKLKITKVRLRL